MAMSGAGRVAVGEEGRRGEGGGRPEDVWEGLKIVREGNQISGERIARSYFCSALVFYLALLFLFADGYVFIWRYYFVRICTH